MTIAFNDYPSMKKFCGRLFMGEVKDNTLPIFSECNFDFVFKTAYVRCKFSVEEMQTWLRDNKIKVNYVSQFG